MATVEDKCAAVLSRLSEAAQSTEDPSSFENSSTGPQRFESPDSNGIRPQSSTSTSRGSGGAGGFTCCVPGCFSNNKRNPELSFYNFPNGKSVESQELRNKWINLISRKDFTPTMGHRVCSLHFPGGRKTYMNQLPLNVPKATKPTPTNPRLTTKARNRTPLLSKAKRVHTGKCRLFSAFEKENENGSPSENVDEIVSRPQEKVAELLSVNERLKAEIERLKTEKDLQKSEIKILSEQLQEQAKQKYFSVQCFKDNDSLFRFYTELQDFKTFEILLNSYMPAAKNLVYYGSKTDADRLTHEDVVKSGPERCLSVEQELFLVLVRLRLGLLEADLATRAGLSQSQISRIFITWVDFLHSRLRSYPIWPTRESTKKTMPRAFKEMYPTTRVIIDCSELFIETPSSFRCQSATYSNYKHHNTAKGLVGISPSASVTFVSDLYTGRSSDKQITIDCGILNLLEDGDTVMADKGFDIDNDLPSGVSLNIPPFLCGKEHLSLKDETETRRIASLRIHVERAIARIKNFRILSTVFPISMAGDLNKIWVICCHLTNFLPPLLTEKDS